MVSLFLLFVIPLDLSSFLDNCLTKMTTCSQLQGVLLMGTLGCNVPILVSLKQLGISFQGSRTFLSCDWVFMSKGFRFSLVHVNGNYTISLSNRQKILSLYWWFINRINLGGTRAGWVGIAYMVIEWKHSNLPFKLQCTFSKSWAIDSLTIKQVSLVPWNSLKVLKLKNQN